MTIAKKPRWMKTAVAAARTAEVVLPWHRGQSRAKMIARRLEAAALARRGCTMRAAG